MRKILEKIKFFNKSRFYKNGDYLLFKNLLKKEVENGNLERNHKHCCK